MDRDPRVQVDGRRGREARAHGGEPPRPGRRTRRRDRSGIERDPPRAQRLVGPEPSHRIVHLPRPDRRGEDRARARAGRVPLRRRARARPHRHERVPRAAHRVAPHRRSARLRRLRRRRSAHGDRPPPPVQRLAARRDREGAPRRVQRLAPAARRRAADRRTRPDGRFPEHGCDHDVEPRQPHHHGRRVERRCDPGARDGRDAPALPAGVPEPGGRDLDLPPADAGSSARDRRHPAARAAEAAGRAEHHADADRQGQGVPGRAWLRSRVRRASAEAAHPEGDPGPAGASPAQR